MIQHQSTALVDHESYVMTKTRDEEEGTTLVVRRMNIIFAKKECQVLNITDVTSVIKLEREREKYRLMKKLKPW